MLVLHKSIEKTDGDGLIFKIAQNSCTCRGLRDEVMDVIRSVELFLNSKPQQNGMELDLSRVIEVLPTALLLIQAGHNEISSPSPIEMIEVTLQGG
ncbi:hypothetical protein Nepgr_018890 [Nepenthes gracilis]|uniref:Uncharacterized protein n=1 Tax=Nepenthes gracilis TaxID=150966 RepID=A0AAD3SU83_NEPGR|nr:hypothetical protein Nepgr_018890 [Nepenthes gracilis]